MDDLSRYRFMYIYIHMNMCRYGSCHYIYMSVYIYKCIIYAHLVDS